MFMAARLIHVENNKETDKESSVKGKTEEIHAHLEEKCPCREGRR